MEDRSLGEEESQSSVPPQESLDRGDGSSEVTRKTDDNRAQDGGGADEDDNATVDETSHSRAQDTDESMRAAAMDGSKSSRYSRSWYDSDNDSFVSCSSGRSHDNNDSDSQDDDRGSNNSSEYSESMRFSSLGRELELGYKTRRRSDKAEPEGAPSSGLAVTAAPGEDWQSSGSGSTHRRSSRGSRVGAGRGKKRPASTGNLGAASPPNSRTPRTVSPPRTTSPRRAPRSPPTRTVSPPRTPTRRTPRRLSGKALKQLITGPNLGYGDGSPGKGGAFGRGKAFGRSRSMGGSAAFRRSSTNDGIPSSRPLLTRSATERFVISKENGEDGRPKLRRKFRSRSMDMTSPKDEDDPLQRNSSRARVSVAFGKSREQSHYQPHVIRKCKRIDLQTGGETNREVLCQRIIDYPEAMNPAERLRKTVVRTGNDATKQQSMHGNDYNEAQYRLQSRMQANHRFQKKQMQKQSIKPGALTTYLIWSLKSHFVIVLLSEAIAYWVTTSLFALCIYLGAYYQPECLRFPDNKNFEESGGYFIDAFAVSWTTFSTVGYGAVHPQIRREPEETAFNCAFMTTITALEAFVGVLFASFCGAVIVGKITRIKSTANVRFSERMILRFGTGVMFTDEDDDRIDDRGEKPVSEYDKRRLVYPCPVLEFRLANPLFRNSTGEIMNARLSVVGSTLADKAQADPGSLRNSVIGLGGSLSGMKSSMGLAGMGLVGSARPGLDKLKGMTHSASQFLRRPLTRSASYDPGSNASQFLRRPLTKSASSEPGSNNLFLAARKTNSGDLEADNNSFTSIRNIIWSSTRATSSDSDLQKKATEKESVETKTGKRSVLRRVSKVGKDAIESVVIKKRLMRTRTPPAMPDSSESSRQKRNTTVLEEDPSGGVTPRKLFSSLQIESDKHPFFKRVWTIRHVLNADSPLLSPLAKGIIKETKGRWPAEACNDAFIRKNVDFQQLIVSLSGVTAGNKVYGLHVYEYRNLHVGYTFSPILQYAPDGRLFVDIDSIDNIQEQRGGGAEAVDYYEVSKKNDSSEPRNRRLFRRRRVEKNVAGSSFSDSGPSNSNSQLNLPTHSIEEIDESMLSASMLPARLQSKEFTKETELLAENDEPLPKKAVNRVSFEERDCFET